MCKRIKIRQIIFRPCKTCLHVVPQTRRSRCIRGDARARGVTRGRPGTRHTCIIRRGEPTDSNYCSIINFGNSIENQCCATTHPVGGTVYKKKVRVFVRKYEGWSKSRQTLGMIQKKTRSATLFRAVCSFRVQSNSDSRQNVLKRNNSRRDKRTFSRLAILSWNNAFESNFEWSRWIRLPKLFSRCKHHLRTNVWVAQHVTDGRGVAKGDLRGPNTPWIVFIWPVGYNVL